MKTKEIALGGVTAALALTVMCLGGIIPIATFICPTICCIILQIISGPLGKKGCWVWYFAVSILSLLMAPDKEAASVLLFLGYYPIIKEWFDKVPFGIILKVAFFNIVALTMYLIMIHLFGMYEILAEFETLGLVMTAVTLLLGNATFFSLDLLLGMISKKFGNLSYNKNGNAHE